MSRPLAALILVLLASCAGVRPAPRTGSFPPAPEWKTLLDDFVTPPLAADARRVFVATRDGVVRSLDSTTGAVAWKAAGLPGRLSAADGTLLLRAEDGTLSSLHPRTGAVRWQIQSGVTGSLPALIDGDLALVAGQGLAAVDLASGRTLWADRSGVAVTAPPARAGARLLTGEADGTLRCRDRATGASLWTLHTRKALLAPPLVDATRRLLYLGTTDKRILEVRLDTGKAGWRWTVGADVAQPGLLLPDQVLFAPFDAVLYAIERHRRTGSRRGNLAWRGNLPSRPLSGPLLVSGLLVVACLEDELVAFDPNTGRKAGALRTAAVIATPPLASGSLLVIGLRDRSVVAYALGPRENVPSEPTAPAKVEPPATGR